jgi:hypothetical protein
MSYLTGFLWFWYDFIVGDAWEIAAGVIIVMIAMWLVIEIEPATAESMGPLLAASLVAITAGSLWYEQRGRRI